MCSLYANFKGGTGKNTVAFNLALWQLDQGQQVQVWDLDPQRTLSDVAAIRTEEAITPPLDVINHLPARPGKGVQRLAFRRSFSEGLSVSELEPRSKAAGELDALTRVLCGA